MPLVPTAAGFRISGPLAIGRSAVAIDGYDFGQIAAKVVERWRALTFETTGGECREATDAQIEITLGRPPRD
jgi:hypothetical protein